MRKGELNTIIGAADLTQHIEARLYNVKATHLTDTQADKLAAAGEYLMQAHLYLAEIYQEETGATWENGNDSAHALPLL
jgi:hypothetical protein